MIMLCLMLITLSCAAICALASADELSQTVGKNYFAFPSSIATGEVMIFDVGNLV